MSGPEEERSNEVGWRQWHQLGSSALCCERDQRVWGMSLVAGGSFDVRGKSLRVVKSGISCLSPSVVLVVEGMKPVPWMRCSLGATCLCNLVCCRFAPPDHLSVARPSKCFLYSGPLRFCSSTWKLLSASALSWLLFLQVSDRISFPKRGSSWPSLLVLPASSHPIFIPLASPRNYFLVTSL